MNLVIDGIEFNIRVDESKLNKNLTPLIFLHGFTGSSEDWTPLVDKILPAYLPTAIDLIGHGKSSSPDDTNFYTQESIVKHLEEIFNQLQLNPVILVGYSMGGRAALSYASAFPQKIKALVLESSSPGLTNEDERETRFQNDKTLAYSIEAGGINKFIDYWLSLPLFQTQNKLGKKKLELIKNTKIRTNNVTGLKNSLLGFSTGKMTPLWDKLPSLDFPVLLVTGTLDTKFTLLNKEMDKDLNLSFHKIVDDTGHNVFLENEQEFIILLNTFLDNLAKK